VVGAGVVGAGVSAGSAQAPAAPINNATIIRHTTNFIPNFLVFTFFLPIIKI
jgi:hypothetical protein